MAFNTELSRQLLINPTLAIKAGSSPTVKSSNAFQAFVGGKIVSKAAGDMPALTGTIPAGATAIYAFQMDSAGTLSVVKGANLSSDVTGIVDLGAYAPATDNSKVTIGLVTVVNGTASTFTGGTTALDTASLTVYYTNLSITGL